MFVRLAKIAAAAAAFAALAGSAAAQNFNGQQQAEIRAIVRDYLVNNPDVLREALDELAERSNSERIAKAESDPRDFSVGPANAPITIVEFFDYRCPFCTAALPWVADVLRTRRDVRFVFKELPLDMHGEPALNAARASIAAMPQGRYFQFHQALLNFSGDLTDERIDQLARQSGIDVPRMRRAMTASDEDIMAILNDNRSVAVDLSINGTPGFLINGQLVSGADRVQLDRRLREATREVQQSRQAQR